MMNCDSETGACLVPEPENLPREGQRPKVKGAAVRYIGDPMCSWCWGLSPVVRQVEDFCQAHDIEFSITMGGLRAGGGDPWNDAFKAFLRNEWTQIARVTGQPFGYDLLERTHFDYDTEPACRAVVTAQLLQARHWLSDRLPLRFFSAVQRKFYVEGSDPKAPAFYEDICQSLDLDFTEFRTVFASAEAAREVQQAFAKCRQWGVRSFPTLLAEKDGHVYSVASGYVSAEQALARLAQVFGHAHAAV